MATALLRPTPKETAELWSGESNQSESIEKMAISLIKRHVSFRARADQFEFTSRGEVLTIRGSVPSFYLKQVLQTMLAGLDGVKRIENLVDVVSSHGLSSVRDEMPNA
jgi:hypothetical protein